MNLMILQWFILLVSVSFSINTVPHIVALSIPKSGSFLLYKCINLITQKEGKHAYHAASFTEWDNYFVTNHELPMQEAIAGYKEQNIKGVFIYRDPRDQVVSAAYFFKEKLKNPRAVVMDMADLITDNIYNSCIWWKYVVFVGVDLPYEPSIKALYDAMLPWAQQLFIYTTTFEKLVGPQGGGDRELQIQEIINIAKHVEYPVTQERAEQIADQLFGRFETFREGKIGGWKESFSLEQKDIFKQVSGDLLINLGYEDVTSW